ncbi:hypothetical protein ACFVS2_26880 [Brevibacillus sp. NPDC058079]|uniref:hypothetical protein n=1 Tax=Brevibacillus sp. NPDC058079 TaxID=3346330 RepID=UPI0036EF8EA9
MIKFKDPFESAILIDEEPDNVKKWIQKVKTGISFYFVSDFKVENEGSLIMEDVKSIVYLDYFQRLDDIPAVHYIGFLDRNEKIVGEMSLQQGNRFSVTIHKKESDKQATEILMKINRIKLPQDIQEQIDIALQSEYSSKTIESLYAKFGSLPPSLITEKLLERLWLKEECTDRMIGNWFGIKPKQIKTRRARYNLVIGSERVNKYIIESGLPLHRGSLIDHYGEEMVQQVEKELVS